MQRSWTNEDERGWGRRVGTAPQEDRDLRGGTGHSPGPPATQSCLPVVSGWPWQDAPARVPDPDPPGLAGPLSLSRTHTHTHTHVRDMSHTHQPPQTHRSTSTDRDTHTETHTHAHHHAVTPSRRKVVGEMWGGSQCPRGLWEGFQLAEWGHLRFGGQACRKNGGPRQVESERAGAASRGLEGGQQLQEPGKDRVDSVRPGRA